VTRRKPAQTAAKNHAAPDLVKIMRSDRIPQKLPNKSRLSKMETASF
jgi:hypothetical protein